MEKFGVLKAGQMFTWKGILMMRINSVVITEFGPKYEIRRCVNLQTGQLLDQNNDTPIKVVPRDSDLIRFLKND